MLEAYLARLQNLAGDRPLVMAEIGLDSRRNGLDAAGRIPGLAGPHRVRGGLRRRVRVRVDRRVAPRRRRDRGLGLRARRPAAAPKPALDSGSQRVCGGALPAGSGVASRLGGRVHLQRRAHARRDVRGLARPRLPRLRGHRRRRRLARTRPRAIAASFGFRVISTENRGLSAPQHRPRSRDGRDRRLPRRRRGPDPHWLRYLVAHVRDARTSPPSAARTSPPGDDPPTRRAWPGRRAARSTCCCRTRRRSTSPAATWRSAATRCWRSAASTRASRRPVTTSTSAGASRSAAGTIGVQPGGDGLAPPARHACAPTCASSAATAGPRRCSSASGRRSTTPPATSPGRAASTGRVAAVPRSRAARASTTDAGGPACSSGSTRRSRAAIGSLPLMPEWLPVVIALGLTSAAGSSVARRCSWPCPFLVLAVGLTAFDAALSARRSWSGRRTAAARAEVLTAFLYLLQPLCAPLGSPASTGSPVAQRDRRAPGVAAPVARKVRSGASAGGSVRRLAWTPSSSDCAPAAQRRRRRRLRPLGPRGRPRHARPRPAARRPSRSTARAAARAVPADAAIDPHRGSAARAVRIRDARGGAQSRLLVAGLLGATAFIVAPWPWSRSLLLMREPRRAELAEPAAAVATLVDAAGRAAAGGPAMSAAAPAPAGGRGFERRRRRGDAAPSHLVRGASCALLRYARPHWRGLLVLVATDAREHRPRAARPVAAEARHRQRARRPADPERAAAAAGASTGRSGLLLVGRARDGADLPARHGRSMVYTYSSLRVGQRMTFSLASRPLRASAAPVAARSTPAARSATSSPA